MEMEREIQGRSRRGIRSQGEMETIVETSPDTPGNGVLGKKKRVVSAPG
jgi:hypothetical protein